MLKFIQQVMQNYSDALSTIVLTPNQRLASYLYQSLDKYNIESKNTCWEKCTILPFASWLTLLWENLPNSIVLFSQMQEYALWEKIIRNSNILGDEQLPMSLDINYTIQSAIKAWHLLYNWQVPIEQLQSYLPFANAEIKYFFDWVREYKEYLAQHNYCTLAELPLLLTNFLQSNPAEFKKFLIDFKKLFLVGFTDFTLTPQEKCLLKIIEQEVKLEVVYFDLNHQVSQQRYFTALDYDEEVYAMARWAHGIIQKHPNAAIGCVVPNLQLQRETIIRVFGEIFYSPGEFIHKRDASLPPIINLSLGKSLAQYPLISDALLLLSLGKDDLSFDDWQQILTSPFLADNWKDNIVTAAKNWETIKGSKSPLHDNILFFKEIYMLLKDEVGGACIAIKEYQQSLGELKGVQSVKTWLKYFNKQLSKFGWPGSRKLNSCEQQLLEKWQQVCHELELVDLIYPEGLSYLEVLTKINAITQNIIFQPKAEVSELIRINVLGVLESAGLNFDYLWVMSMDDKNWPPPIFFNPFLPSDLQKKMDMPNVSVLRQLAFCRTLMRGWQCSASEIIYSYAQKAKDSEVANRMSPLMKSIDLFMASPATIQPIRPMLAIYALTNDKIKKYFDDTAPIVVASEKIGGGVGILQSQISCPFQAFAIYRLGAVCSKILSLKTLRGNIIHKSLEEIWLNIKGREKLQRYWNEHSLLRKIIFSSIDKAFNYYVSEVNKFNLTGNFLRLEKRNLYDLIMQWLEIEKRRDDFVVVQTEKQIDLRIADLFLQIRVDRIDQLSDGRFVVIDYKTGKKIPRIKECLDIPPTSVQLPLYALAMCYLQPDFQAMSQTGLSFSGSCRDLLAALIFACVNRESINKRKSFIGIVDENMQQFYNDDSASFEELDFSVAIDNWRNSLACVADSFMRGVATVSPHKREICKLCDLQVLCRIKEKLP